LKKLIVKFAISFCLLSWFLWHTNRQDIWVSLQSISIFPLILALTLFFLVNLISAYKWNTFLPESPFLQLLKFEFISQYYSLILPGQVAGEAMKIYFLGKGQKNAEQIAVSVFFDRLTGIIGLLLVALGGIYLGQKELPQSLPIFIALVIIALCVLMFSVRSDSLFRLFLWCLDFGQSRFAGLTRVVGQIHRAAQAWRTYLRRLDLLVYALFLGVVFHVLRTIICAILAGGLGIILPFSDWCWVLGAVSLALFLPITVGGIGLREGAFIGLLGYLGVSSAPALALSFTVFFLTLCGAAVGAILEWIRMGHSHRTPKP
jgi:uncharacterized protein (TIRG00374 family)